jgi:hypothetical protein
MKFLFDIIKSPFAIATAVIHWLVFFYWLLFVDTRLFTNEGFVPHRSEPLIYQWLVYLNVIPLVIVEQVSGIFNLLIGMNLISNIIVSIFALLLVNFQWLLIGYCLSKLFFNSKETDFSLK